MTDIIIIIDELFQPWDKKYKVANVVAIIFETVVPSKIKNKKISFLLIIPFEILDNLPPCLAQTLIWKALDEINAISKLENNIEKNIPKNDKINSNI